MAKHVFIPQEKSAVVLLLMWEKLNFLAVSSSLVMSSIHVPDGESEKNVSLFIYYDLKAKKLKGYCCLKPAIVLINNNLVEEVLQVVLVVFIQTEDL